MRHRTVSAAKVAEIASSIRSVGLLQPITVFTADNSDVHLVAGLHRLEAVRSLGWDFVDAVYLIGGDVERELAEIAENLHRAELTALERDEQVARWIELVEVRKARSNPEKPSQIATVSK